MYSSRRCVRRFEWIVWRAHCVLSTDKHVIEIQIRMAPEGRRCVRCFGGLCGMLCAIYEQACNRNSNSNDSRRRCVRCFGGLCGMLCASYEQARVYCS